MHVCMCIYIYTYTQLCSPVCLKGGTPNSIGYSSCSFKMTRFFRYTATQPAMSGHISAVDAAASGSVGAPF